MPHYADGTPAQVGDVVRGTGYNIKKEITATVTDVRPGDSCTLTVQFMEGTTLTTEYGDTKVFTKVA